MTFDKEILKTLRKEMDEALKRVAEKHGIQITVGNASFTATEVSWKVQMVAKDENGKVHDRTAEDFKFYAHALGMKPEDLGREFTANGTRYRLDGYDGKKRKFAMVCTNLSNGKKYRFPVDGVMRALGYNKVEVDSF